MAKKKQGLTAGLIAAIVLVVLVAVAGGAMVLKVRSDKQAAEAKAAKLAYISKLEKAHADGSVFEDRLYDTAARYGDDLLAEQAALEDMATVSGEVTGSSDTALLDGMLSDGQVIAKMACQCSDSLAKAPDLLKAYSAGESLRVRLSQLQGRITTLKTQAK